MGAVRFFSADSRDYTDYTPSKIVRVNSTPDPRNFKVIKLDIINGYPILKVKYPDVENYEGEKILMFCKNFDLRRIAERIDPHFYILGDSPIARFEPTDYGWDMAVLLAKKLE